MMTIIIGFFARILDSFRDGIYVIGYANEVNVIEMGRDTQPAG